MGVQKILQLFLLWVPASEVARIALISGGHLQQEHRRLASLPCLTDPDWRVFLQWDFWESKLFESPKSPYIWESAEDFARDMNVTDHEVKLLDFVFAKGQEYFQHIWKPERPFALREKMEAALADMVGGDTSTTTTSVARAAAMGLLFNRTSVWVWQEVMEGAAGGAPSSVGRGGEGKHNLTVEVSAKMREEEGKMLDDEEAVFLAEDSGIEAASGIEDSGIGDPVAAGETTSSAGRPHASTSTDKATSVLEIAIIPMDVCFEGYLTAAFLYAFYVTGKWSRDFG